jgi:CBS domain-containing protein
MAHPDAASASLLAALRVELMRGPPFAQMTPAQVDRWVAASHETYHAPGETVLAPDHGPVKSLLWVRRGAISGRQGVAASVGGFQFEVGDLFPVGALLAARAVTATYEATEDCFCLVTPAEVVQAIAAESPPLADFLNRRVQQFLRLSQQALQTAYASQTLAEQSLERPLGQLPRKTPVAVAPGAPLREALERMHDRRVGSVLVVDADGVAQGILTRYDVLGRVTLPQRPMDDPIDAVMSAPLQTLDVGQSALDAALLMSRHGIRHVPITEGGRVVSIISERDLFALQRLSLKSLATALRASPDLATLKSLAGDIRRFAANLLGQGVHARQLTALISHLNDTLTARWVRLVAERRGLDLAKACWLAFGSEGRAEQTVATDQDNGLVFESETPDADRPAWLAFAREVNDGLDACGYPRCPGEIMASNPDCCLSREEWLARFARWMEQGAPEDLLHASIFFDLRPLAGADRLASPLRRAITDGAGRLPRFMKQMADNALRSRVPLNWRGAIEAHSVEGREWIDLKLNGTALFVDVARLYALALGVDVTGTRERLEAVAPRLGIDSRESEAWVGAFEFLQMLRLRVQMPAEPQAGPSPRPAAPSGHPNLIELSTLHDIDRRVLKEALRVARRMRQRLELDYAR